MNRLVCSLAVFKFLLFFFVVVVEICFWFFAVHDHFLVSFSVHHHHFFMVGFGFLFFWIDKSSFVLFLCWFFLLRFRLFFVDELLWLLSNSISSSILLLKTYPIKEIFFELNQFMFDSILFLLLINRCFGIFAWLCWLLVRLIFRLL